MKKDVILTDIVNNKDVRSVFEQLGLDKYEPVLVPDKETENRYRIERSDDNRVLRNDRAVGKKFKTLSNTKILEIITKLLESNEKLELNNAAVKNYGENIFFNFKIKDFEIDKNIENIPGIGKIEPNITINLPVIGNLNFIVTAIQLFCSNQVIGLSTDPLTSFMSIQHNQELDTVIDKVVLNYSILENYFNDILNK